METRLGYMFILLKFIFKVGNIEVKSRLGVTSDLGGGGEEEIERGGMAGTKM
jgi:hypothetical protein